MLSKLRTLPGAQRLLPFVRMSYGAPSQFVWVDDTGESHVITQGEGGEQGDPLMPALFCLGLHGALSSAAHELQPGEQLVAYLDDIYLLTQRERARRMYDVVTGEMRTHAGVEANLGKTECWSSGGGAAPPGIAELGVAGTAPVWKGDLPLASRGVEVLGAPLGSPEFVRAHADERLANERHLLDMVAHVPDVQAAWLLLLYCAAPRSDHLLRNVPPDVGDYYAQAHDRQVRGTLAQLLNIPIQTCDDPLVQGIAQLPIRLGGLGLRSSCRIAPCAYWASWADTLHTMHIRFPEVASGILHNLRSMASEGGLCRVGHALRGFISASDILGVEGFALPSLDALVAGTAELPDEDEERAEAAEPGERRKGWQRAASDARERHERQRLLEASTRTGQARLRSSSGPHAGRWLSAVPAEAALELASPLFRFSLCRRLGLPVCVGGGACEGCGRELDAYGFHRATCMRTGRVHARHKHLVAAWRRVFGEAGINIPDRNVERFLRDTHIRRGPQDGRRMDLVTPGIANVFGGAPLFIDATMVSPLHGTGVPMANAATTDGAVLAAASNRNSTQDYPDVEASPLAQLLCLGVETYGRWGPHCLTLVRQLARNKASTYSAALRRPAEAAHTTRWWSLLSVAAQRQVAETSLREAGADLLPAGSAPAPPLDELLDCYRA